LNKASILVVDDEEGIRHGLENLFRRQGWAVHTADGFEAALAAAGRYALDVALVDLRLRTGKNGIDLLVELKRQEPDLIVIVITGYGSIDTAVTSLKSGAADYFLKPIDNSKLLEAIRRHLELRTLQNENRFLKDELDRRCLPHQFLTRDPALLALLAKADKVKDSNATVLITGESGTGKEVLARYIHFTSNRAQAGFIGLNCAALSESLLLSELFGHERGAFTGAVERRRGKFELADGGTLFLDEIGDMSLETQAKVLRVIEESSFERVGGTKSITVDVRIIAATNQDLPSLIRAGRFREDLFYRINVVALHLTPLRERRGDIELLARHFLKKFSERYLRPQPPLSAEAFAALQVQQWPGNARELENLINQFVLLGAMPGSPKGPQPPPQPPEPEPEHSLSGQPLKQALAALTNRCERRLIADCLRRNGGNKSRSARELGITRKTLARKIALHGLQGER
jgi:DNA-binding NtrC family response regulator